MRGGKGASIMKLSWSVFTGPVLEEEPSRTLGLEEPRERREERTVERARGSTSMGMVGQLERRRFWSLRWSD